MSFTVFLGNLPTWVTADDIKQWLAAEDLVSDGVKVIRNHETQESKGFAFVEAPTADEMQAIIRRFDRAPLEDRLLRANPAQPPKGKDGRPVAALAFSSAPRHLGPRDRFIGWPAVLRRANIRLVAYNPRFLVLPWVRVPHLASHVLSRILRRLSSDWQQVYGHPVHFVETFVDPTRFKGTCYRAANWVYMGLTTGRGKDDQTGKPNRSLKEVLGYPLAADFRKLLQAPS